MIYDLHIHINPHADEGEIYEYDIYAKMLGIDVAGFVVHYNPGTPERVLKNFRDTVSTFSVKNLAGVEIYYPSKKVPRGFDYYLYHFSNITIDAELMRKFEGIIIAHPFAYGTVIDPSALEIMERRDIAIECNSAHYEQRLAKFYEEIKGIGILVPFGSDAHTPQEMGSGFAELEEFVSPYEEVEKFLGRI